MDGGTVMIERRQILMRGAEPFVMTDGEAEAAMTLAAELPATLRPEVLTRFDPLAAAKAAAAYARARNRERDSLLGLYLKGRIMAAELRAGRELCLVMEWRQGAYSPLSRTGGYVERMAASTGMDAAPLGVLMQAVEADRYIPWRGWCRGFPALKPPPAVLGIADLVEMLVLGNKGVWQVAETVRMDARRVRLLLRRGLHRYARIAGWVTDADPPEIPD